MCPAWSARSASMTAPRSNAGTSLIAEISGVAGSTTAPASVTYTVWPAGSVHSLRWIPAWRRTSARTGKPPTFGRISAARRWALWMVSVIVLMASFVTRLARQEASFHIDS